MTLQIRLYGALRDKVPEANRGQFSIILPESITIHELLARLNLDGDLHVAVNGEIVQKWDVRLCDGDRAEIFHPTAGG